MRTARTRPVSVITSIISDSRTYGMIGAVFAIMTWLIAIGAVIILGAVAGVVWEDRKTWQIREQ